MDFYHINHLKLLINSYAIKKYIYFTHTPHPLCPETKIAEDVRYFLKIWQ